MAVIDRRTGLEIPESGFGGGALDFLYGNVFGRILLKYVAAAPWFSRWRGGRRDRPESKDDILPFLEENRIDLSDGGFGPGWQADGFDTFNEFFTRQRDYGAYYAALREHGLLADPASERAEFPAVADARLSVWPVGPGLAVPVKQSVYTLSELLGDRSHDLDLKSFEGGHCLVFRLGVDDYHRYVFPDSGRLVRRYFIPGELHTVRPVSERYRVYARNARSVSILDTDHFGPLLTVEVGAMLVGHIVEHPLPTIAFDALQEKGYFEFGGSTVLLVTGPNVTIDTDLLEASARGDEVKVRLGEPVGRKGKAS
ncbi:MAG: phosphatidylserine decarboxylase [Clostridia bacterium]|nr:phosphatidylserine decarboxylase [Clostridia bacterium]MBQ6526046.1 phosphatidylserine decarboxylase [Clostridia bacterium]MBQ6785617.1 phosphatidylserine decarboxylase [Clostridia bacterium]